MAAKCLEYSPKRRMIFDKFFGKEGEEKCLNSILEHHFNFSVSNSYNNVLFNVLISLLNCDNSTKHIFVGWGAGTFIFQTEVV
jgi:hypothetical protein